MVYRWHMRWQMSGMLIPRYSFQFAQTFSLPFSPPLCRFIRVYMQIIQDVHAQLVTKGGSSTLCSPPPQAPHCPLPNCFFGFLGAKFMQDMPEIHEKAEKKRKRRGRGCSAFKCSSCAGNAGQVACGRMAGMLHFQDAGDGDGDGGLSIEIMALPVQEKW